MGAYDHHLSLQPLPQSPGLLNIAPLTPHPSPTLEVNKQNQEVSRRAGQKLHTSPTVLLYLFASEQKFVQRESRHSSAKQTIAGVHMSPIL